MRSTTCWARTSTRPAPMAVIPASARPAAPASSNLKAGKFGAFVGCTNYPECRYTRPLAADSEASADRVLGQDPETGRDVIVKAGRFGPYIQLGDQKDYAEGEKPKRAGIPKNISPADIELDLALKLLSLPREIGLHPESGQPITAGLGRFGPFVKHEKTYASLEAGDEVFDIGLNRAVTLIAEKVAKGPSGRRFGADPGKPLGDHPSLGTVAVEERPLWCLCHGRRHQCDHPEREDAGDHHASPRRLR